MIEKVLIEQIADLKRERDELRWLVAAFREFVAERCEIPSKISDGMGWELVTCDEDHDLKRYARIVLGSPVRHTQNRITQAGLEILDMTND